MTTPSPRSRAAWRRRDDRESAIALVIGRSHNQRSGEHGTSATAPGPRRNARSGRFSTGTRRIAANVDVALVRLSTMNTAKAVVLATDCRGPEPWPSLGLATRHLAPVANKPVLFHHLEMLSAAGIGETAIVCDRRSSAGIREAVGDGSDWDLDVRYVEASPLQSILASSAVADFVGAEPVLMQHGDILLHDSLSTFGDQFANNGLDALV